MPGVITRDPKTGVRNVGMYRIQVIGANELAMHWQRHKVGAAHWREMAARGERMPVAIALGGDPASMYAASAPLPPSDRKSTRLNSSHLVISYAVFCLKKKS